MIKFYKKTHLLALAATAVGSIAYAAEPTFILKNNSRVGPIQVNIMQNGKSVSGGLRSIAKNDELALTIPITTATTMELHYCTTASSCKTELPEKLVAKFPQGKTMYIKFDGKQIEVQKGIFGTTTGKYSGLYLQGNVSKNQISISYEKNIRPDLGGLTTIRKTGAVTPVEVESTAVATKKPAKPTAPKPQKPVATNIGKTNVYVPVEAESIPVGVENVDDIE